MKYRKTEDRSDRKPPFKRSDKASPRPERSSVKNTRKPEREEKEFPKKTNRVPAEPGSGESLVPFRSGGMKSSTKQIPHSKKREAQLTPEDAYNRSQKQARLLREKGKPASENPTPEKRKPKAASTPHSRFLDKKSPRSQSSNKPEFDDRKERKPKSAPPAYTPAAPVETDMRLNKYIAHCGIASRRAADELIMQGHVTVNGTVVQEMGYRVKPKDVVAFKGKPVKAVDKLVYYLLNKPTNVLTTTSDEKGRRTVIDIMNEKIPERIYPVGRLDRNTSGLLLLTNDGELTKKLSHPSHKVPKVYHVTLDKNLALRDLEQIRSGITLEDGEISADSLHFIEGENKRHVQIEVHSGRNRLIRRIFEHLGYEVVKLDRTYYAGLTKKNLARGMYRPLTKEEVRMLKHFI